MPYIEPMEKRGSKITDPGLTDWRLIGGDGQRLGILVGIVSGHPKLPAGWITTSLVREIAADRSWAITRSRRYVLGEPMSADEPLPPEARGSILSRLLRNAGDVTMAELERLDEFAEQLSKPECEVFAPADIRDYQPLPNPGETPEEFEEAKRAIDAILRRAGY